MLAGKRFLWEQTPAALIGPSLSGRGGRRQQGGKQAKPPE